MKRMVKLPHRVDVYVGEETVSSTGERVINYDLLVRELECVIMVDMARRVFWHQLGSQSDYTHTLYCYKEDVENVPVGKKPVKIVFEERHFEAAGEMIDLSGPVRIWYLREVSGG